MKNKPKLQPQSQLKQKRRLEFSKKLTLIDIITWIILSIGALIILLIRPELGVYIQNIFSYLTAAYVSLRLGYTAKAGVENYKKIAGTYQELTKIAEDESQSDSDESAG